MAEEPNKSGLPIGPMAMHAVIAFVFFFGLQKYAFNQPTDAALMWGIIAAPFAAYLAYSQARR